MKKISIPEISEKLAMPLSAIASPQRIAILLAIGRGEACVWMAAGIYLSASDGASQSGYFAGSPRRTLRLLQTEECDLSGPDP